MSILSKTDNFDDEKNEYIAKLRKTVEVLERILGMRNSDLISAEKRDNLAAKLRESRLLLKKLENDEYEVAIVGLEKAGKSSFANALIKSVTLPTDEQRCTYTATRIEYSEKDEAVVSFFSRNEFEKDFRDKLNILKIPNADKYNFDVMSVAAYEEISANYYDSNNRNHSIVNQDIIDILQNSHHISECLGRADMTFNLTNNSEELNNYIVRPEKARAVKEVVIRSHVLNDMKNAVIYDVPGFNSPTVLHKQQTLEKMKSADAIIVVSRGDEPSITGDVLEIILKNNDDDGIPLKDKLFLFANKSDRILNVERTINTTYSEWIDKHKILTEREKNRIFFGSANAYLQACGLLEVFNEDYVSAVQKRPGLKNGDGIDAIRTALAEYNRNERFEVLKRRINRTQEEIISAFSSVNSEYSESMDNVGFISNKEYYNYISAYKKDVDSLLKDFKDRIKNNVPKEIPLSKAVKAYIESNVTKENYHITEEEIDKERKNNGTISNIINVNAIENVLRPKRFVKMYQDFTENVVNITDDQHIDCMNEIVEILIGAMGVENGESKKIMTDKVKQLVEEFAGNDKSYYQSIIERFSRDIYEILIQFPQYSDSRLDKFNVEADNFYSLSVFYKNEEFVKDNEYINIPPKEQPLCRMLLFSDYFDLPRKKEECENKIIDMTRARNISEKALKVLTKVVRIYQGDFSELISLIDDIFTGFNVSMSDENKKTWIEMNVDQLYRTVSMEDSVDISDPNFRDYYISYGQSVRKGAKTTEDFCDEFAKDIEVLADILKNAFVNAIKLEKPFITREIKIVEDIIDYISNDVKHNDVSFNDFISDNLKIIKSDSYLKKEYQKKVDLQNIAVLDQINTLLGSLKG